MRKARFKRNPIAEALADAFAFAVGVVCCALVASGFVMIAIKIWARIQ